MSTAKKQSSKPFPWKCGACRERAVQRATIEYTTPVEHDGRKYIVTIPDLVVARCKRCGEIILDDHANQRISESFRLQAGLLTPLEIRENRERLRLTQRELASALGIAEATLSRWETGGQIQQRALDRLMRLYFFSDEVRRLLADNEALAALDARHAPDRGSTEQREGEIGYIADVFNRVREHFSSQRMHSHNFPREHRNRLAGASYGAKGETMTGWQQGLRKTVVEYINRQTAKPIDERLAWSNWPAPYESRWLIAPLFHRSQEDAELVGQLWRIADTLDRLPEKQEIAASQSILNLLESLVPPERQTCEESTP